MRADELYVVAGDATQIPRNSHQLEGVSWLRNLRPPPFRTGIHYAQRWFNGCWMMPAEQGYSRAMPLRWLPAFTEKARCQATQPCKEWQAALQFMTWLLAQLSAWGRSQQTILLLGDGNYDTLPLWQQLPQGIILLARSARNRALYHLPTAQMHRRRKYGERAPGPQDLWRERTGWKRVTSLLRGRQRRLQYRVEGPFLRKRAADTPLFLLIVRGQKYTRHGRVKHREPRPYLVNAVQDAAGNWTLPLDPATLIFWAWQRWEVEVCHRELKSNFGLGNKQCWHPEAAVLSVQWSAWVYALLLLSAYRSWSLCGGPQVPTRWWRGAGRWSLNTLWRAYRAELWGQHDFRALWMMTTGNWYENEGQLLALRNAIFGAARS